MLAFVGLAGGAVLFASVGYALARRAQEREWRRLGDKVVLMIGPDGAWRRVG